MDFTYKRATERDFATTVQAVESAVLARGFVVCRKHDLQAMLAAKGFGIHPLRIYEVALEGEAETAGAHGSLVSLCRIHVYEEGGEVYVTAIRPTALSSVLSEAGSDSLAERLERSVVGLVDAATGRSSST